MRILAIENEAEAGLGVFADPIAERSLELATWRPAEGDRAPEPADFDGIIALGGAMNVAEREAHPWIESEIALLRAGLEAGTPTLGVCLGSQMLVAAAGVAPTRVETPEIGWFGVTLTEAGRRDPLLSALPESFEAFQWHSWQAPIPDGGVELARSPACPQAYRIGANAWGIQFHAEVSEGDALRWTSHHADDPDFERNGLDPDVLASEIRERMPTWNALGRQLSARFCELVATRA